MTTPDTSTATRHVWNVWVCSPDGSRSLAFRCVPTRRLPEFLGHAMYRHPAIAQPRLEWYDVERVA